MKLLIIFLLLISTLFSNEKTVKIKAKLVGENVVVYANNDNPFSVTVNYNAQLKNLSVNKKKSILFVLEPYSKKEILKLHINKKSFSFIANYNWTIGSKDAKHNNAYVYKLPYKSGTKEMVSQGFDGKFTHFDESKYAVDFNLKEGTEVYSARDGVVVFVKEDSNRGGSNRSFIKDANCVIVEHSDGTLASYSHLKQNGVVVEIADKIKRGQLIAYSGKTGYAKGAHLHFVVYKAVDGKSRVSVPVKFQTENGVISEPVKGQWYRAI